MAAESFFHHPGVSSHHPINTEIAGMVSHFEIVADSFGFIKLHWICGMPYSLPVYPPDAVLLCHFL
jgi:hypothetical protein